MDIQKIVTEEKLLELDLLGHKFSIDIYDIDIEAVQKMAEFADKAQKQFSLEMFDEMNVLFEALIGEEYKVAMIGKRKSIKTFACAVDVVLKILEEITKTYEPFRKNAT